MVAHARLPFHHRPPSGAPLVNPAPDILAEREIWLRIDAALVRLHDAGRRAIRILDAGCGAAEWLLRASTRARDLGFTAIDGVGFDSAPERIAFAEAGRTLAEDAHIGLSFSVAGMATALEGQEDASFDILLCLGDGLDRLPPRQRHRAAAELARVADGDLFARVRTTVPLFPAPLRTVGIARLGGTHLLLHARVFRAVG